MSVVLASAVPAGKMRTEPDVPALSRLMVTRSPPAVDHVVTSSRSTTGLSDARREKTNCGRKPCGAASAGRLKKK